MNAEGLLKVYEQISEAPDAVARLRRFVLDLAVRGKLVEQDAGDEPASELFVRMKAERLALERAKKIKKIKFGPLIETATTIPANWAWTQLGNVGDWGSGSTPQRGNPDFYGGGITWLKSGELGDSLALHGSEETVTELALSKCSFRLNKPGDVLIAMYGATIGKLAILAEEAVTNQAVCGCTPFAGLSNRYLFLFLLANRAAFHGSSEGGAQPNISKVKIVNTAFPLPPTNEQHRIVAKVDELMGLCDRLEAARGAREEVRDKLTAASLARLTAPDAGSTDTPDQTTEASQATDDTPAATAFHTHARFAVETLPALTSRPDQIKTLRQTILNLAVRGKLVEQDPAEWAAESGELVTVGEQPFEIPDNWSWHLFGNLADMINGDRSKNYPNRSEYQSSGVAWINTGHIQPDGSLDLSGMHYITQEKFDTLRSGKIQPGDLVYCLRGATFGKTGFVEPFKEGAIASSLMIIRLKPEMDRLFAYHFLMSPYGKEQLYRFDNGTAQPNLSAGNVRKYLIPLPPLAEQHRIVAKVDALMALCDRLEAALTTADTFRTRLLNALLHEALAPATPIPEAAE